MISIFVQETKNIIDTLQNYLKTVYIKI